MLHLHDRWVWDFWLVADGADQHVFYLQAPRSLGDPRLRHHNATIGHAVSGDLRSWEVLPDALGPGRPGAWDDGAPWTGSVVRADGEWRLYYTGSSSVEDHLVQRIGVAVSDDLLRWERPLDHPIVETDTRWYERLGDGDWPDEAWRDPWVTADPASGELAALICARARHGPPDERGAVALARSRDGARWSVEAPVYHPGLFAQLEVPQVVTHGGRSHLLFCTPESSHARRWTATGRAARTGTYHCAGRTPFGPFTATPEPLQPAAPGTTEYAGKLHAIGNDLHYLATILHDRTGAFVGALGDPRPASTTDDGRLVVDP